MRPTLPLLACALAACSQPDALQLAAPAPSLETEAARPAAPLETGGPASVARVDQAPALVGPDPDVQSQLLQVGSFYQVPPILEDFWTLAPAPLAPAGLLADPEANQDDFEEWYAGASDYQLFTTHRKLTEYQAALEVHPNDLTAELEFLGGEVGRRGERRSLTRTASTGPRDYTVEYRGRDLDFVTFRQWELGHELNAYRKEAWKNGGRPFLS